MVMREYGYEQDELISKDRVACGIVENGEIVQQNSGDLGSGFFVKSFDDSSDQISNVQAAIVERLGE